MVSPEHEQPSIPLTPLEELAFVYQTVGDALRDRPLRITSTYRASSVRPPSWHAMAIRFPVMRSPKTFRLDTA